MSGTFFDYGSGRLEARFSHDDEFDYINLDLTMKGEISITTDCDDQWRLERPVDHVKEGAEFQIYMTSVFCPFGDFIRFLEAITIEVQECSFEWNPEGPSGKMRWDRRYVNDSGFLTVEWHSSQTQFSHRMMLNTRQAVRALYTAFRSFVESPEYNPLRYEEITYGEAFTMVMSNATLDEFVDAIAKLDTTAAHSVITRFREVIGANKLKGPGLRFPIEYFFETGWSEIPLSEWDSLIPNEWDLWSLDQRISDLNELFGSGSLGWYGVNLRNLRSDLVENWLALPEPSPRSEVGIPRSTEEMPGK